MTAEQWDKIDVLVVLLICGCVGYSVGQLAGWLFDWCRMRWRIHRGLPVVGPVELQPAMHYACDHCGRRNWLVPQPLSSEELEETRLVTGCSYAAKLPSLDLCRYRLRVNQLHGYGNDPEEDAE